MPIPTNHYETMKDEIPEYYKGKNGYMAKDVVSNFDLSYNIGKAIHHLHFELDVLTSKTRTGALSPTGVRK